MQLNDEGVARLPVGMSEEERAEWEECRELHAMLSANVAACYLKMVRSAAMIDSIFPVKPQLIRASSRQQRWKEAVTACDEGKPTLVS